MTTPTPPPMITLQPVMLILRGITGTFGGHYYPHGALVEPPALEYARRRGYDGRVLDCSGEAYEGSPQALQALACVRCCDAVAALYCFSGGGYNARHVLDHLHPSERERLRLVVILGAPGIPPSAVSGPWELVCRGDPPAGHMAGPAALLAELGATA